MNPLEFNRRILIAVTGLSPQIVTETLYALAVDSAENDRYVPTEIHIVTTAKGAEHARLNLLSEEPGQFHRLCRDYPGIDLEKIKFDESSIHVIARSDAEEMDDIRNSDDN